MKHFIITLLIVGNSIFGTVSDNNEKLVGVKLKLFIQILMEILK
jgi:hypothetical protein